MRRKPHHWPNHINFYPLTEQQSGKTNQTVFVSKAVFNAPLEERKLLPKKSQQNESSTQHLFLHPKESSTFGGRFVGSVQKSFVGHELLNWTDFVNQKLYLEHYQEEGKEIDDDGGSGNNFCQKGYPYNTISPCRRNITFVPEQIGDKIPKAFLRHLYSSANDPVYEKKNADGRPFSNILELRAAKIKNFLSIPSFWQLSNFAVIQYESLLEKDGIPSLIQQINRLLGTNESKCPNLPAFRKEPYRIPNEFREWIAKETIWDLEYLVGYGSNQG
jgi:hypothetical protein